MSASDIPRPPRGWKGNATRLINARPGITIPEIAAELDMPSNHLYKWLPEASAIERSGRGWYPAGTFSEPVGRFDDSQPWGDLA